MRIDCICPLKGDEVRHPDGDDVTLRPYLGFVGATAVRHIIGYREDGDDRIDVLAAITETYLLYGIDSWTVTDGQGKPVEITRDHIRERMALYPLSFIPLGDQAHELYSEAVVIPLLGPVSTSSRRTQTGASTSRTSASSTTRTRGRSKPSSTTTSPTDDTATTSPSPAGDSSS